MLPIFPVFNTTHRSVFAIVILAGVLAGVLFLTPLGYRFGINIPFSNAQLSSESGQKSYQAYLKRGFSSDDGKTQFVDAYETLLADYKSSPEKIKRETLVELSNFLKNKFSGDTTVNKLEIPCLEAECGYNPQYSENLRQIKEDLGNSTSLEPEVKKELIGSLDKVADYASKGQKDIEYSQLFGLFNRLKQLLQPSSDSGLVEIAKKVLAEMNEVDTNLYQINLQRGKLEI